MTQQPPTTKIDGRNDHSADPRGFIPPHPDTETARRINDAIRAKTHYPTEIGVFCDRCGNTVEADYLVSVDDDQFARFEIARAYLRTIGWRCEGAGDLCPNCLPKQVTG